MTENWCTIESDPGVFTELLEEIGVKDCQVEELYALDVTQLKALQPVYGLIFLFKWSSAESDNRPVDLETDIFFANQVINNACATQAILAIILNSQVDMGEELSQFREFTKDFPPEMKGLAISNSDLIRRVHNSFARPEPFVYGPSKKAEEDDDVYHFISYLPYKGCLYELDGLKPGPINLGPCTEENWVELVGPMIQKRIEQYSRSEIRFNLMAVIKNRIAVAKEQIEGLGKQREEVQALLLSLGEEAGEQAVKLQQDLAAIDHQIEAAHEIIRAEEEKRKNWKLENVRRKHNYIPFIMNMIKLLAEKGELVNLVERAKQKERDKETEKRKVSEGK
jgi:ubiquitin carboxyl-terminal hydrolase L5